MKRRTTIVSVVIVMAVMAVAAGLLLHSEHVWRRLLHRLNAGLPGTVEVQALRFSLLAGTLRIENAALNGADNKPIAGFEALDLSWRPLALVKGRVHIDTVVVTRPWCHLETGGDGRVNLARALINPAGPAPPARQAGRPQADVQIGRIAVTGGRFVFTDRARAITADIDGIGLQAGVDLKNRRAALDLQVAKGRIETAATAFPLDGLTLKAHLGDNSLHDLSLALTGPGFNVLVNGRVDAVFGAPVMDIEAKAGIALARLKSALNLQTEMDGVLEAVIGLKGGIEKPQAHIDLTYGGGRLAGMAVAAAEARLRFKDNRADLDLLRITLDGGRILATAQADLGDALANGGFAWPLPMDRIGYRASLSTDELLLEKLLPAGAGWQGRLKLDVAAQGTGIAIDTIAGQATLAATAQQIRLSKQMAPVNASLLADITADKGLVTFTRLDARAADAGVSAAGTWRPADNHLDGRIAVDAPDLERALAPLAVQRVSGQLKAQARVQGTWPKLAADIDLDAKALGLGPWAIGNARVNAGLSPDGMLSITTLAIDNKGSRIDGAGKIALPWIGASPAPMTFNATLTGVDIAAFAPRSAISGRIDGRLSLDGPWPNARATLQAGATGLGFDPVGIGSLNLEATLHGPLDRPGGKVMIAAKDLFWEDQRFSGLLIQAESEKNRWRIDRLEAALTPDQQITGNGWVDPAGTFSLRLDTGGIDLANIARLQGLGPIQGVMSAAIEAGGPWNRPELTADLGFDRLQAQGLPLADATFTLRAAKGRASLTGDFYGDIQADINLRDGHVIGRWDLETDHLAPLLAMAGFKGLDGRLAVLLDVSANTAHLAQMTAAASVRRLELHQDQRHLIRAHPFDLRVKAQHLHIPNLEIVLLENGRLTLSGSIGADGPIALAADGAVPLAVLEPFAPDLTGLNGQILIHLTAGGTITEPQIDGELRLDQVGLTLPVLDQKLTALNALIRVSPQALTIATAEGRLDQRPFTLAGRADFKGLGIGAIALSLKAEDLTLTLPETLWLRVGLDIGLEGTWTGQVLSGNVMLHDGLYHKPVNLSLLPDGTARHRTSPEPGSQAPASPLLGRTRLDLAISAQAPLVVDNNLAQMNVVADLRLGGTLAQPVLTGQADVVDGTIRYRRRAFEVTRGNVAFTNPYRTEAYVDVEGQTRVRQWDIFLNLTGTLDRLGFAMRSQPPEDDGDILSLLLMGRTKKEMIGAEGGVTQSAGQMLAEMIATRVAEDIKQTTGLDIVDVAAAGGDAQSPEGTRVTLGKTLSPRMTVKVETDTGGGDIHQRAVAEYRILEGLMMKGYQDSLGRYGGALQYRLEFR